MTTILESYAAVTGADVIRHLQQLAELLKGKTVVHVNSTRVGGGVAEILDKLVPLTRELGSDTRWEVITGDSEFYQCTKTMHNAIQGNRITISDNLLNHFRYLFNQKQKMQEMGAKAKEFVRENFLLTRQLREYLTLMVSLQHGSADRIELT